MASSRNYAAVISNMTASVAEYVKYAEVLVSHVPPAARAVIQRHRAAGDYESPEYGKVLREEIYNRHFCRLDPWPEPVQRTMRTLNSKIYNTMQGPDEFTIIGNLKHWDVWDRLHDPGLAHRGPLRRDVTRADWSDGKPDPTRPGRDL